MLNGHDKKGPELFIIDEQMLNGLENLANQFKEQHDEHNYNFIISVKTAITKYPALAKHCNEIATMERLVAKTLNDSADFIEQLMPLLKKTK